MICKTCYYNLYQNESGMCPECGCEFDPMNPQTYLLRKPDQLIKRIQLIKLIVTLCVIVPGFFLEVNLRSIESILASLLVVFVVGIILFFNLSLVIDAPIWIYRYYRAKFRIFGK